MEKLIIDKVISLLKELNIIPENSNTSVLSNYILEKITSDIHKNTYNLKTQEFSFEISNRRYIGNKTKLIPFIKHIINKECKEYNSFFDVFGGTGIVAHSFNTKNTKIIINDLLKSNKVIYEAWFGTEFYDIEKIRKYIFYFNNISLPNIDNYVSINFGDTYFSYNDALKIGYIRDLIEELYIKNYINKREKSILLTSLLYAIDKIANTCGTYDSFRKNLKYNKKLIFKIPKINQQNNFENEIYNMDSNLLVKNIEADIVYIDPPYTSRQYGDAYHLLENIIRWEKPEVTGIAKKMINRSDIKSKYCTVTAPTVFEDLINNLKCKYILVSYNHTDKKGPGRSQPKISDTEILKILKNKGLVKIFEQDSKSFNNGKLEITGQKERIFFCVVLNNNVSRRFFFPFGNLKRPQNDLYINTFYNISINKNIFLNIPYNKCICIDNQPILIELFKLLQTIDSNELETEMNLIMSKYNLSNNFDCNKDFYKNNYKKLLYEFNQFYAEQNYNKNTLIMLLIIFSYSFHHSVIFYNKKCHAVFQNNIFYLKNLHFKNKIKIVCELLKDKNILFKSLDFKHISLKHLDVNDFFYFDIPTFYENEKYIEDLFNFIDSLKKLNIIFILKIFYTLAQKEIYRAWIFNNTHDISNQKEKIFIYTKNLPFYIKDIFDIKK